MSLYSPCKYIAAVVFLSFTLSVSARAASMTDLGTLGGSDSYAFGISGDGSTIVGYSLIAGDTAYHAFSYSSGVMTDLGTFAGGNDSVAMGISGNGSTIAGYSLTAGRGAFHAFSYSSGVMTDLGTLAGGSDSYATGISGNGSTIIGYSGVGGPVFHAFSYSSGGMVDLGTLSGGANSFAQGASTDGSIIVGYSDVGSGGQHAFSYSSGSMMDLGTLGGTSSRAYAISGNGSIIVGNSDTGSGAVNAFSYSSGSMTSLGTLGGTNSQAYAISSDGSVIVGISDLAGKGGSHAFSYYSNTMHDLGTLGGTNSTAEGVSADGSTIVGYSFTSGNTATHAFVYRGSMVDVPNTYTAIGINANQLNSVINLKTTVLSTDLNQDCTLFGPDNVCVQAGTSYWSVNSPTANQTAVNARAAYRFNHHFHAGLFVDQSVNNQMPSNFKLNNAPPLVGVFGSLSQNEDGTGTHMKLAGAYNNVGTSITRSVLANTEAGQGNTQLVTQGILGELAYGFGLSASWQLQPFVGLLETKTTRNAYTETSGASFPVSYNAVSLSETVAVGGARINGQLTEILGFNFAAGLEHDLSSSMSDTSGTIDTMGAFSFAAPSQQETRAFASVGGSYAIKENQQLGLTLAYSQQALNSATATGAYLSYTIGF